MTEATKTDKAKTKGEPHELDIPWFLDAKNPDNIRRQKDHRTRYDDSWSNFGKDKTTAPKRSSIPAKEVTEVKVEKVAPTPIPATKTTKAVKVDDGLIIRILKKPEHREGSQAEAKSAGLVDGMTVGEYKANSLGFRGNWQAGHVKYMVDKKFIKLEG